MHSSLDLNKTALPQIKISIQKPKILIVEDDPVFRSFWLSVINTIDEKATVSWVGSEMEAESMIFDAIDAGQGFDLVIADIFLVGLRTGIDLWTDLIKIIGTPIIITSGIDYRKFSKFFKESEIRPLFLQKPLNVEDCANSIRSALKNRC